MGKEEGMEGVLQSRQTYMVIGSSFCDHSTFPLYTYPKVCTGHVQRHMNQTLKMAFAGGTNHFIDRPK